MTDLEALYESVLAHPDDDTARLVYADKLEETGDEVLTHLANYIRYSIEAAQTGSTPELVAKMTEHGRHVKDEIMRPFHSFGRRYVQLETTRGLPDALTARNATAITDLRDLLPHYPITRVIFSDLEPQALGPRWTRDNCPHAVMDKDTPLAKGRSKTFSPVHSGLRGKVWVQNHRSPEGLGYAWVNLRIDSSVEIPGLKRCDIPWDAGDRITRNTFDLLTGVKEDRLLRTTRNHMVSVYSFAWYGTAEDALDDLSDAVLRRAHVEIASPRAVYMKWCEEGPSFKALRELTPERDGERDLSFTVALPPVNCETVPGTDIFGRAIDRHYAIEAGETDSGEAAIARVPIERRGRASLAELDALSGECLRLFRLPSRLDIGEASVSPDGLFDSTPVGTRNDLVAPTAQEIVETIDQLRNAVNVPAHGHPIPNVSPEWEAFLDGNYRYAEAVVCPMADQVVSGGTVTPQYMESPIVHSVTRDSTWTLAYHNAGQGTWVVRRRDWPADRGVTIPCPGGITSDALRRTGMTEQFVDAVMDNVVGSLALSIQMNGEIPDAIVEVSVSPDLDAELQRLWDSGYRDARYTFSGTLPL